MFKTLLFKMNAKYLGKSINIFWIFNNKGLNLIIEGIALIFQLVDLFQL